MDLLKIQRICKFWIQSVTLCICIEYSSVLIFDVRKPGFSLLASSALFMILGFHRLSLLQGLPWAFWAEQLLASQSCTSESWDLWLSENHCGCESHVFGQCCVCLECFFSQHILYQIEPCTPEAWRTDLWPIHEDHGHSTAAGSGQSREARSALGLAAWWGLQVAHPLVMLLSFQKQPWAWLSPPSADPSPPFPCLTSADGKIKAKER